MRQATFIRGSLCAALCVVGIAMLYALLCACVAYDKQKALYYAQKQAPAWSYTVNGQSFDYATQCWTENGTLLCDAEDGTRLKVDSYTPMYWEGQE